MTGLPPATASPGLPDLPGQDGTAQLLGYGRISWDQLTGLLAEAETAWADYSGFHIGPVPAEPPPYSHLWAWTSQWLARTRIDNGNAITGVLVLGSKPPSGPAVISRETVRFQRARATTWPQAEKRVGRLPSDIADRPVDIYLIPGDHPITFAALPTPEPPVSATNKSLTKTSFRQPD